jgi:hypothetical protein
MTIWFLFLSRCAAHLNMLCNAALRAYERYGIVTSNSTGKSTQHGMLLNYDSLPGIVPSALLPLFGVYPSDSWVAKMKVESTQYSKSRSSNKLFTGDSQDKEQRATENIVIFSQKILQPTFERMNDISLGIMKTVFPHLYSHMVNPDTGAASWNAINQIQNPSSGIGREDAGNAMLPSTVFDKISVPPQSRHSNLGGLLIKPFRPWEPFASTHYSIPYEVSSSV